MLEIGAVFMCTETELILKSRRVVPGRLLEQGLKFKFSSWDNAARNLYQQWKAMHADEQCRSGTPVWGHTDEST